MPAHPIVFARAIPWMLTRLPSGSSFDIGTRVVLQSQNTLMTIVSHHPTPHHPLIVFSLFLLLVLLPHDKNPYRIHGRGLKTNCPGSYKLTLNLAGSRCSKYTSTTESYREEDSKKRKLFLFATSSCSTSFLILPPPPSPLTFDISKKTGFSNDH